jgi:photosystem II stability/assembly factor-like uncharacterized protein
VTVFHPGKASDLRSILALLLCAAATLASGRAATTDYAFSWSNPKPQGNGLFGVAFENASVGYAVGKLGAVLRTTDGGATWLDRTNVAQFSADLNDVAVLSPGVLLAAGASPGLYRSTDAGETWATVANPAFSTLHNLHRLDPATLTAVGDNGVVLRSIDNGATWTALPSPGSFAFRDQYWSSPVDGYVCGVWAVRHTTNGGQSWTPLPGVTETGTEEFHDIFFTDASNGWVLEFFNTYRTTNGEASCFVKNGSFPASPGAVELLFESTATGVCDVDVYDAAGRRVASFRQAVGRGPVTLAWQAPGAGVHFVALRDPAGILHTGRILTLR